jgi:phenol 2-monooxygenase/3-hydroxybenzoate 4-monooxygenase
MGTHYRPSTLCGQDTHQHLATGLVIGERFHSAKVLRAFDAKPVELGHCGKADGRWRLYAFAAAADKPGDTQTGLGALCHFLKESADSPLRLYTAAGQDMDAVFDVRGIYQQTNSELNLEALPVLLCPPKGRYGLLDYEKAFCAKAPGAQDIYEERGIDRAQGALVVVRPDQYIAHVLPLHAHKELSDFFAGFMLPQ